MMKTFLSERKSWIFLFIFLQLLLLFIAYLDHSISFESILYFTFLSTIIFVIFILYRYQKETRFYQSLKQWENKLDITAITGAESPFEKIIEQRINAQTEQLKQEASQNWFNLEAEKDELLAWIHEVKTPLTAMHLMIERIDDEKMKSQLKYEWLRIYLLLDQQLHQKRLPFMENDLYIELVDIKKLIFTEIKELSSWCIQKGIGFDIQLEVTEVLSDAKWLAFILRQLLTNAVKYSEASDIIVKSYQNQGQTYLEVIDFGRGIDQKDLPRIFDKGYTSTKKHQNNAATGMGLYLAKKAANPLLIHIEVQSNPGCETIFRLTFPQQNEFVQITGM